MAKLQENPPKGEAPGATRVVPKGSPHWRSEPKQLEIICVQVGYGNIQVATLIYFRKIHRVKFHSFAAGLRLHVMRTGR